jgi:periplasmic mercuric ion binding protein
MRNRHALHGRIFFTVPCNLALFIYLFQSKENYSIMKTHKIFITIFCILFCSVTAFAQKTETKKESIKVWGNCDMCKKNIETAAKNAGATSASWNTETKILAFSFNSGKSSNQKIQKAIAAAGYDTKDFTASDDAYNKLHFCCQYDRKSTDTTIATSASCCDLDKCGKDTACCKDTTCCEGKQACKDSAACKEKECCKS